MTLQPEAIAGTARIRDRVAAGERGENLGVLFMVTAPFCICFDEGVPSL